MTKIPAPDTVFELPSSQPVVSEFQASRRSNLAKVMTEPGPNKDELAELLRIAARVPDHRKLAPWRFLVFEGDARADIGQSIASVFAKENPDLPLDRTLFESQRFLRAPTVVTVVSSPVECVRGTPEWEQRLSAGAVCYNLLLATQASGYGVQWLTEWYAYHDEVKAKMGLKPHEKIAGFIYMGTPSEAPKERARADVGALTEYWTA
ncbi:MAG: nitroreductase family protein [Maricaulaceae bacterium]